MEWLLATHENGRGPVDQSDESQRERKGLDLRGTDLRDEELDGLPLAGAVLTLAHLEGANLTRTHLEGAMLDVSHLEGTILIQAHLEDTNLYNAFLNSATRLDGIVLSNKECRTAYLADMHWGDVNVTVVDWSAIPILGDEHTANRRVSQDKYRKIRD